MASSPTAEVQRALRLLTHPDYPVELRVLKIEGKRRTDSGYFTDMAKAAQAAATYDGNAPAIYITLNPVMPDLLARANNRMVKWAEASTADDQVVRRWWLPIDFDPRRPSGTSSTDEEHQLALDMAAECRRWLMSLGWPDMLLGDSGNGAHLLPAIDLPNTPEMATLVQKCLQAIAAYFSKDGVDVDTGNFNASRIWKLYGTMACKGDAIPTRPHRRSRIISTPEERQVVTLEQLQELAAHIPDDATKPGVIGQAFDVDGWLAKHGIGTIRSGAWSDGYKWVLDHCPFSTAHSDGAFITQLQSGAVAAGCHHNSCKHKWGWVELRAKYDGPRDVRTDVGAPTPRPAPVPTLVVSAAGEISFEDQAGTDAAAPPEIPLKLRKFNRSDSGNAERFVADHGDNVRYVAAWGCWLVWDETRWIKDDTFRVYRLAQDTIKQLWAEVSTLPVDTDEQRKERGKWYAWCITVEGKGKIEAMLDLARTLPGITITHDELDANPWLINCLNGTINLKTGQLQPHDRDDLITKRIDVAYDPAARAPIWETFLHRVMGEESDEMVPFLARAVGYTLTATTAEQCLFFAYGTGHNGKSVFFNTLADLLGEYWLKAPTEMIMAKTNSGGIPNDVARLFGARMVVTAEIEEGRRLAEALVKDLTGDDTITARFLHKEYFDFDPTHKLWIYGNHRPMIRGTDPGIWRRIKEIPFAVTIPAEERDRQLGDKLLAELPGILSWAVRGCLDWQDQGLAEPEKVKRATAAYRAEMDVMGIFITDKCVTTPHATVKIGDLYSEYVSWCDDAGEFKLSKRRFGTAMTERGFDRTRGTAGTWFYVGLGLATDEQLANAAPASDPSDLSDSKSGNCQTPGTAAAHATINESKITLITNVTKKESESIDPSLAAIMEGTPLTPESLVHDENGLVCIPPQDTVTLREAENSIVYRVVLGYLAAGQFVNARRLVQWAARQGANRAFHAMLTRRVNEAQYPHKAAGHGTS